MIETRGRIKAILKSQERSQAWLARQIGMNETLLAHYLSGRRPAPADLIPRLARALHVPESLIASEEAVAA